MGDSNGCVHFECALERVSGSDLRYFRFRDIRVVEEDTHGTRSVAVRLPHTLSVMKPSKRVRHPTMKKTTSRIRPRSTSQTEPDSKVLVVTNLTKDVVQERLKTIFGFMARFSGLICRHLGNVRSGLLPSMQKLF